MFINGGEEFIIMDALSVENIISCKKYINKPSNRRVRLKIFLVIKFKGTIRKY
jgi:hypothetical protein